MSSRSTVLAPFNTTIQGFEETIDRSMLEKGKILYSLKVRDVNRNYEINNNGMCDNGVLITNKSNYQDTSRTSRQPA